MAWPTPQDYSETIQSPAHCFKDPELRSGSVETDRLGLPRPIAGGFAVVYQIRRANKSYAVRCFLSEVSDLQERYRGIEAAIRSAALPYFLPFAFLDSGIRVQGRWFPVLKMEWTDGVPLMEYIQSSLTSPETLTKLAYDWQAMCVALANAGIAHGDLQHGNVLIYNGKIILVDYDGMFVPSLRGKSASELGHRHYQHPQRKGQHFDSWLDRFAASSILAAILALSIDPRLWDQAKAGDESLIFRKEDYESPDSSPTLQILKKHQDQRLQQLAQAMDQLIRTPLQKICLPKIENFGFGITEIKTLSGDGSWLDSRQFKQISPELAKPHIAIVPPKLVIPAIPEWLEISSENDTPIIFNADHRLEIFMFGFLGGSSLISAMIGGNAGILIASIIMSCLYIIGGNWLRSRFERHPLSVERRNFETTLPDLRKESEELRAKWQKYADRLVACQTELQNVPQRLEQRKMKLDSSWASEMAAAKDRFKQLDDQDKALSERENSEIAQINQIFNNVINQLKQEIADLVRQQDAECKVAWDAHTSLKSQLAGLASKYNQRRMSERTIIEKKRITLEERLRDLESKRQTELDSLVRSLQQKYVSDYLSKQLVTSGKISGIGPVLQKRIADSGIRTAEDIKLNLKSISSIPGIGSQKQAALKTWYEEEKIKADSGKPRKLPPDEESSIRQKYANEEVDLRRQLSICQQELRQIDARINAEETQERNSLNLAITKAEESARADEQKIRDRYANRKINIESQIASQELKRHKDIESKKAAIKQERDNLSANKEKAQLLRNAEIINITTRFTEEFQRITVDSQQKEQTIKADIFQIEREMKQIESEIISIEGKITDINNKLPRYSAINLESYIRELLAFK